MKNPTIEGGSHYDDTKQQNFAKKREPINSNGTQMLALADYAQQLNVKSNCQKTSCNWSHDDSDAKKYENIYNVEEADTPKRFQVPEDFSKTQDKQMKYAYGSKRSCDRKKKFEKTGNTSSKPSKGVKFSSDNERTENNETNQGERINFQTCASVFQISSDVPSYPTRFSAAYPPILNEVMTIRSKGLGLKKKDSFLNSKLCRINFLTSEYETKALNAKSVNDLSENSILFPKNEEEKFDCSSLFTCKRNDGLKVFDTDSKSPKISDNMINMANETLTESKGEPSLDSLTMMKKVKEIVDFDLNNAVKIFKDGETEPRKEVSSVVIDRGHWEVDEAELEKCIAIQKDRTLNEVTQPMLSCAQESIVKYADQTNHEIINANDKRNKIEKGLSTPTFFPGRKENETMMRVTSDAVNSVITYNPTDNRFDIYSPDIDEAMRQSNKSFDILHSKAATPIVENNQNLLKVPIDDSKSTSELETYEMKSGDSILVFDELTQTWNVDYSILEKRKERMRQEEELTKKSELILENFEKLEQRNISNFPKPDSREKKIFDYNSKKWKEYKSNEKSNSSGKSTKSKCPFKESDAEEIRKENSDLYENLFVVKKETKMSTEGPESSGVNPGVTKKEASSNNTIMTKDSSDGSKGSDKPPLKDNENLTNKTNVPTQKKEVDVPKEEDSNFWETFLKKNIPPFERPPEPRPVTPPPPSPPPTPQPPLPSTPPPPPYAEKIISKIKMPVSPLKKIDEPRFRIPLPFNWDRKKEVPKLKTPKTDKKQNNSEGKGPLSSPNPLPPTKEERPAIKPPSPPPGPPGPAKPNPTTPIGSPKQERPAIKVPPPPTTPQVKDSPSVKNPSPPTGNSKKEDIVIKAPQSAPTLPKQDPQSKTPPAVGSSTKNTSLLCTEKDIPQIKASKNSDEAEIAQELKPKVTGSSADVKKEKNPSEHYVSDNIVEMSKSHTKDFNSKAKSNKIETVKLNITSEARMPSRITEINLKFDETIKESNAAPKKTESNEKKKFSNNAVIKDEKSSTENRFYKNFEKYKSPFSDPEYEEKSMKINSDLESNPNLKKLDNWNKTLVLHDTVKPPENIESWLKDETDKMATLLLKVLQEAAEGKPRKKPALIKGRSSDRTSSKGNPYDNIRKKQESSPESFLFKVRSVNLALEADKKLKTVEATKQEKSNLKNIPVQSAKTVKPSKIVDAITSGGEANQTPPLKGKTSANQTRILFADPKPRLTELTLEPIESNLNSKDLSNSKLVGDTVNDIPGPEILKKISNTWKLLPVIDSQITIFTLRRIFQLGKNIELKH